jgi:cell division protein FtsN
MYHSTGVGILSESQKSKLRNGHPVRIKLGSGNTLNLTDQQIKKLQSAHKKGLLIL